MDGETSVQLFERARLGDDEALNELLRRYLPRLRRWASGRLPRWARNGADTDDLVQEAVVRTFRQLDRFEFRQDGALQAYLRQVILNRIRDYLRSSARRPVPVALSESAADMQPSPLEEAIGEEALRRYEKALAGLRPEEREAVIARVEMGCGYDEIAAALGKPSEAAARMAVTRALVRLAEGMRDGG